MGEASAGAGPDVQVDKPKASDASKQESRKQIDPLDDTQLRQELYRDEAGKDLTITCENESWRLHRHLTKEARMLYTKAYTPDPETGELPATIPIWFDTEALYIDRFINYLYFGTYRVGNLSLEHAIGCPPVDNGPHERIPIDIRFMIYTNMMDVGLAMRYPELRQLAIQHVQEFLSPVSMSKIWLNMMRSFYRRPQTRSPQILALRSVLVSIALENEFYWWTTGDPYFPQHCQVAAFVEDLSRKRIEARQAAGHTR